MLTLVEWCVAVIVLDLTIITAVVIRTLRQNRGGDHGVTGRAKAWAGAPEGLGGQAECYCARFPDTPGVRVHCPVCGRGGGARSDTGNPEGGLEATYPSALCDGGKKDGV